jgi:hypothetical protein
MPDLPESNVSPVSAGGEVPTAAAPESDAGRQERRRRARHYFLTLARRAEANPDAAETLSKALGDRIAEYWEPALEAVMQVAESLEYAQVHPVIDAAIARSLREKPDLRLVTDLYNRIPLDTVLLRETGLEVFRQTVRAMEDRKRVELHPVEYLTLWLNYIQRLLQSSFLDEAEKEAQAAIKFARERFAQSPDKFRDGLASSLETGALIANDREQYAASRGLREEEIGILRGVSGRDKSLAQCHNNHANVLKSLGDSAGALKHSQEAVQLYRAVAANKIAGTATDFSSGLQAWVDDPRPTLAEALVGLSTYQNDAKQSQECLVSALEAFDIFFELSEQFPDQFRYHFGMARHNLGMAKFGVGDAASGLREMQAAAAIHEQLAKIHPEAYAPGLAQILASLTLAYAKNERNAEALEAAERCVALYRKLHQETTGRFAKQLVANLENLRILHEAAGHSEQVEGIAVELARLKPKNECSSARTRCCQEPEGGA